MSLKNSEKKKYNKKITKNNTGTRLYRPTKTQKQKSKEIKKQGLTAIREHVKTQKERETKHKDRIEDEELGVVHNPHP